MLKYLIQVGSREKLGRSELNV